MKTHSPFATATVQLAGLNDPRLVNLGRLVRSGASRDAIAATLRGQMHATPRALPLPTTTSISRTRGVMEGI